MELNFDIDQDELPIYLAETDEQLQVLDDGLVNLEKEGEDMDLLQALFRAAHTLKGAAGMIGHKRMVVVTHALENLLDGLRKQQYSVNTGLIDLCLESVDALRSLRDEVVTRRAGGINVDELGGRITALVTSLVAGGKAAAAPEAQPGQGKSGGFEAPSDPRVFSEKEWLAGPIFRVYVQIASNSIASAARAMQIYLALQDLGTILESIPTIEEIETARPVHHYNAYVQSTEPVHKIRNMLDKVGEIDQLVVTPGRKGEQAVVPPKEVVPAVASQPAKVETAAPVATTAKPAETDAQAKVNVEKTVRTSVERLDNLMNLVGELITDRNRLYQIRTGLEARFRNDESVDSLSETITHIGRITDQLQKEVMSIRMLPVSNVFNKFPRMVRDLANKFGKKVDLIIEGEDTELDRSVIEEITDPLIHLVRNAVDHGIESSVERVRIGKPERARILLTARHEQGRIFITVEDDGAGIDVERVKSSAVNKGLLSEAEAASMGDDEAINLIFASGLSTAKTLSDISGRGVGLDIVRNNIQHLNGSIIVETWKGKGSRFQVILPLTLAIVPTLLVQVDKSILAIPLVTVVETLRVADKEIYSVNRRPMIKLRNKVLPLMGMADAFELPNKKAEGYHYVVVVASGKLQMGLMVDRLLGQEEVVVKSLGPLIGEVIGIASAAILGDGQVILIVDVQDLFRLAGMIHTGGSKTQ
jgi:two-component system chemotaxis sensor kinase CheA